MFEIDPSGVQMLKLAVPRAEGDGGAAAVETMSKDMDITGLFQVLDPASFPAQLHSEGLGFSSALWTQVGAQAVIKMKASGGQLEGRRLRRRARRPADADQDLSRTPTFATPSTNSPTTSCSRSRASGASSARASSFAMSGRGAHEIGSIDMDGGRMAVLTKMGTDNLLPAYSPGGGEVAFTSYARNNPDLWIVSAGGGRARRVSKQPGLNTGAAWSPDGRAIALTLSHEGNSEIYRISPDDGRVLGAPDADPGDRQLALVFARRIADRVRVQPAGLAADLRDACDRRRGQARDLPGQIQPDAALQPAHRQAPDRVHGPRREGRVRHLHPRPQDQPDRSRHRQGKGSNLDPTWSPDGRLLAYTSTRGGIFVYNPETRHEVQIWKGSASSPSWGPAPRR